MTFSQARAICLTNRIHVRRESWPSNRWGWWKNYVTVIQFPGDGTQIAKATDWGADDLLATDWTTIPAALMSCPITPTEPNGGNPPTPGHGAFPDDPTIFPSRPGVPGSGSGSVTLPTPAPGTITEITVEFSGIHDTDDQNPMTIGYVANLNLNRSIVFGPKGGTVHFKSGYEPNRPGGDGGNMNVIKWTATAEVSNGLWTVSLISDDDPIWGSFETEEAKPAGGTIFNKHTLGSSFISGGQAVVTVG